MISELTSSNPVAPNPLAPNPVSSNPLDSDWVRPSATRVDLRHDLILAIVIAVGASASVLLYATAGLYEDPAAWWVSALYVILISGPLAMRRRWPATVLVFVAVVFFLSQTLRVPELLISNISLFIALYTLGAWGPSRRISAFIRLSVIVGMFGWLFVVLVQSSGDESRLSGAPTDGLIAPGVAFGLIQILTNLLYFGGAYYFGERAHAAARARAVVDLRTLELSAERVKSADRAVALDRIRIARELHDVVAHHVSVMGVQAGAARRVISSDPGGATAMLSAIESSARAAVDDLHRMLTTLRDDNGTDAATSDGDGTNAAAASPSTRGVAQLAELVADARTAGFAGEFSIVGVERALSPTIDLTLFRIAQEAVTNTVKHAGAGARIDVRVRYLDGAVEIEASDSGGLGTRSRGSGLGHIGMKERVAAVGGTVSLGPKPRGGYFVRARIPVPSGDVR